MTKEAKNNPPRHSCTDEEALAWLRDGSFEAMNKAIGCLYRRLLNIVRPWVYSKNGSGDDAHDAVTEALMKFSDILRDGKYQEEGKLEHFIFRVAQYKFYDICRHRKKGGEDLSLEDIFTGGVPPEIEDDPLEKAEVETEAEMRRLKMGHCLGQIGERCKERLFRFWDLGQSHEEIAEAMGDASPDVSKTMKNRCQDKLEKCMKK